MMLAGLDLSEENQRVTERELSFSEFVLEGLPEAIVIVLEDGKIVHVNPAATRLLGYTPDDVDGKDITLIVPLRDDRRVNPLKWFERWAADPSDTEPRFLDLLAETKAGEDLAISVRVRKAEYGGTNHFLISFRDVSAQRSREAEQRNASLRATRILQIAEDAIISINEDQEIIFANVKAEEVFGYSPGDLVGQPVEMLLPETMRKTHGAKVKAFGRSTMPSKPMSGRGEIQGLRKSGETFPVEASITNVSVGGTSTYTAHLRDITERKAATRALAESELRARAVFDNAFQAMALLDAGGKVLEINPAGVALTTGGDVRGTALQDLPWVFQNEETRAAGQAQLHEAILAGAEGRTTHFVGELTNADGSTSQIDFNLIPIPDDKGQVIYMLAEGRSIAQR